MKYFIALVLAVVGFSADAREYWYSNCDAGAVVGCVNGSNANSGATEALARQTIAQFWTDWVAAASNDKFYLCEGSYWANAASGGNKNNANVTPAIPLVVETRNCSTLWGNSNGDGIRPVWQHASATIVNIAQGTLGAQRAGYTFRGIKFDATGNTGLQTINLGGATGSFIFDDIEIVGGVIGIQCHGGSTSVPASGTGRTREITVTNSIFTGIKNLGILTGCDKVWIEGNTFTNVGDAVGDHSIYLGGMTVRATPPTISSIVGNGSTITVTTSAPHGWVNDPYQLIGTVIAGVTGGTGRFNSNGTAAELITVTGPSTFTYYATGDGVATPGTISQVKITDAMYTAVVRNNTIVDSHYTTPGACRLGAIMTHGIWFHLLIEGNHISESVQATDDGCVAIEMDSGQYYYTLEPEGTESFTNVVIRGNTSIRHALGIMVDGCKNCLIENNYVYTGDSLGTGIRIRGKNFVPGPSAHSGTATSATAMSITNTGAAFPTSNPRIGTIRITGGTGSGQTRRVLSTSTATTLDIYPPWTTIPDATSTYVTALGASGRDPYLQMPENNIIRYNTVHITSPSTAAGYAPIVLNCNVTDDGCGTGHQRYGNLVVMENVTSTSHHCFDTTNMTAGNFARRQDDTCYYKGSAVPGFDPNLGTASGDVHTATLDVTTGQPFFTSVGTSPAVGASSGVLGAGHATLKPHSAWGGVKRIKSPTDRGAYEKDATTVIPTAPTGIAVQ